MNEERARILALLDAPPVSGSHLGRTTLARWAAGELEDPKIAHHLAGCDHCQDRLDTLEAERRAFLIRRPLAPFLAGLEAKKPFWRRWRPIFTGGFVLAAAAATGLVLMSPSIDSDPILNSPKTRIKSGVGLSFHVRTSAGIADGQPGGVYHPGDAIQLRYTSPTAGHLVVVSLDARGAVTPFYALDVEPGVAQLLEGSVILDDALGTERIIGCFSDSISTTTVVEAGQAALQAAQGDPQAVQRLDLDCVQASFTIIKQAN